MSAVVHMDQTGNQRWDFFFIFYPEATLEISFTSGIYFTYSKLQYMLPKFMKIKFGFLFSSAKTILIHSYVDRKCHFSWKMCCLDVLQIVELGSLKTWKTECKKDLVIFVWLRRDCKLILWTHLVLSLKIQKRPISRFSSID